MYFEHFTEDQGTPDDAGRAQGQFGSDNEDKSPAPGSSPYKTNRPSRQRKPPNYKAMDQGLNINLPSPRNSRSGSSPRGARGGQSPKNIPGGGGRGRGSPKHEVPSPAVIKADMKVHILLILIQIKLKKKVSLHRKKIDQH